MANKKLSPSDASAGRARNTRPGSQRPGKRPSTQRPTDKAMPLYTMSGKRTTIEERDSMSEEDRMADVRSKLFTLFDEEKERERLLEEQNSLRNRATGAFQIFKKSFADDYEEERSDDSDPYAQSRRSAGQQGRGRPARESSQSQRSARGSAQSVRPTREQAQPSARGQSQSTRDTRDEAQQSARRPARKPARPLGEQSRPARVAAEPQRSARYNEEDNRIERPAQEQVGRDKIEQEQRVRPTNPVKAMGADKYNRNGEPDVVGEEPRRAAKAQAVGAQKTRTSEAAAAKAPAQRTKKTQEAETKRAPESAPAAADTSNRATAPRIHEAPEIIETEIIETERTEPEIFDTEMNASEYGYMEERGGDMEQERPEASFRLGDLFKEKEPDIFSQWEAQDEEEKRIHARRERRLAEAARRTQEDNDGSKMRTAAALFVVREGIKNAFGKVSNPIIHSDERDEAEKEAENALKALAAAKDEEYIPPREARAVRPPSDMDRTMNYGESMAIATRAAAKQAEMSEDDSPEWTDASARIEAPAGVERPARSEGRSTPSGERRAAANSERGKTAERERRAVSAPKKEAAPRPERKAFSKAANKPVADSEERTAKPRRSQKPTEVADIVYDDISFFDYLKSPSLPRRTMVAWMAGGAAGAAAVIFIALMIVNSQFSGPLL